MNIVVYYGSGEWNGAKDIKDISPEAIDVIRATTNSNFKYQVGEGGKVDMRNVWDEWREEALEEGREETLRDTVKNMYELGLDVEAIAKYVKQSVETVTGWLSINQA